MLTSRRKSSLLNLAAALLTLLLPACTTLNMINAITPKNDVSVVKGIAYGSHPRQRLDIYRPAETADQAAVVVFYYGGAWESGERADYEFVARKLAARGLVVVVPDYRVYPEVRFPGFVKDGTQAAAWVLDHRRDFSMKSAPVFLMGHSAGAHIAMLVGVDQRYLRQLGHDSDELAGIIGLAGPYDFLPLESERLEKIFAAPVALYDSQPINFADAGDPPVLLAHGDRDRRVWLRNSLNMASKLQQAGSEVSLVIYPGVTHTGLMKPFVVFVDDDSGLIEEILSFIRSKQVAGRQPRSNRIAVPEW